MFDRRRIELDDVFRHPGSFGSLLQLLDLGFGRGAGLGDVINPEIIHGVNLTLQLSIPFFARLGGNAAQFFGRFLQFLQERALIGVRYEPGKLGLGIGFGRELRRLVPQQKSPSSCGGPSPSFSLLISRSVEGSSRSLRYQAPSTRRKFWMAFTYSAAKPEMELPS